MKCTWFVLRNNELPSASKGPACRAWKLKWFINRNIVLCAIQTETQEDPQQIGEMSGHPPHDTRRFCRWANEHHVIPEPSNLSAAGTATSALPRTRALLYHLESCLVCSWRICAEHAVLSKRYPRGSRNTAPEFKWSHKVGFLQMLNRD